MLGLWLSSFHRTKERRLSRYAFGRIVDADTVDGCGWLGPFLIIGVHLVELPDRLRLWQDAATFIRTDGAFVAPASMVWMVTNGEPAPAAAPMNDAPRTSLQLPEQLERLFASHLLTSGSAQRRVSAETEKRLQLQGRQVADVTTIVLDIYIYVLACLLEVPSPQPSSSTSDTKASFYSPSTVKSESGVVTSVAIPPLALLERAVSEWHDDCQLLVGRRHAAWEKVVAQAAHCWQGDSEQAWAWMELQLSERCGRESDRTFLGVREFAATMCGTPKGAAAGTDRRSASATCGWELVLWSWSLATVMRLLDQPEQHVVVGAAPAAAPAAPPKDGAGRSVRGSRRRGQRPLKPLAWVCAQWSADDLRRLHDAVRHTSGREHEPPPPAVSRALESLATHCYGPDVPVVPCIATSTVRHLAYHQPYSSSWQPQQRFVPFQHVQKTETHAVEQTQATEVWRRADDDRGAAASQGPEAAPPHLQARFSQQLGAQPDVLYLPLDSAAVLADAPTTVWHMLMSENLQRTGTGVMKWVRSVDIDYHQLTNADNSYDPPNNHRSDQGTASTAAPGNPALQVKQHSVLSRAAVALALQTARVPKGPRSRKRAREPEQHLGYVQPPPRRRICLQPAAAASMSSASGRRRLSSPPCLQWCRSMTLPSWVNAPQRLWQALHLVHAFRTWHGVDSMCHVSLSESRGEQQMTIPWPSSGGQRPHMTPESLTWRFAVVALDSVGLVHADSLPSQLLSATLPLFAWDVLSLVTFHVSAPTVLVTLANSPALVLPVVDADGLHHTTEDNRDAGTSTMNWADSMGQRVHAFLSSLRPESRPLYRCAGPPLRRLPPTPLLVGPAGHLVSPWLIPDVRPCGVVQKKTMSTVCRGVVASSPSVSERISGLHVQCLPQRLAKLLVDIFASKGTYSWLLDTGPRGVFYDSLSVCTDMNVVFAQWLGTRQPDKDRAVLLGNMYHGFRDLFALSASQTTPRQLWDDPL